MSGPDGTRPVTVVKLAAAALGFVLVWVVSTAVDAASATDALRPAIDKVVHILEDPAMKGELRAQERYAALRSVMEGVIDFPEAARRSLAVHWRTRTDAERDEFIRLFKDLVTYSYIRTMETDAGETVRFVGEAESGGATTVLTRIERRQREPVRVDYRMHLAGGRWLVYDVSVEGVSFIANYRTQFNTIIQTSSYAELVRRVRARVAELSQAPAAATGAVPHG